jgi:hypothetical protein
LHNFMGINFMLNTLPQSSCKIVSAFLWKLKTKSLYPEIRRQIFSFQGSVYLSLISKNAG